MRQSSIGEPPAELRASLSREAHLWLSPPEFWTAESIESLLTEGELERVRTLRHPLAQQNYLTGRALVRTALSHYAAVEPSAWDFESNRFGRLEIRAPESKPQLRFNLSHTGGLAACLVTESVDCGVDVEELERRLRPLRIAEHSFAPEEFADLTDCKEAALRGRFFTYWTLKEAYYKARGSGIPFRLGGARFEIENDRVRFIPAETEGVRADHWQFWLLRPTSAHVLAIALDTGCGTRLELRAFMNSSDPSTPSFVPIAIDSVKSRERARA